MPVLQTVAATVVGILALSTEANARFNPFGSGSGANTGASSSGSGSGSSSGGSSAGSNSPTVDTSSAKCAVVAIGFSKVTNDQAIAESSAHAAEYICGGGSGTHTEHDIAEATAEAFAIAVATASAECELEGDTAAYVNAKAHAKAAADVFVEAYADAFAGATVCGKCDAYASSWGYVSKHVFLEAVAKAGFQLEAYTNGGHIAFKVLDFKAEVKKVVAKSFATALAGAASYKNSDGCLAWVNTGGCIWTPDSPDPEACFVCEAKAVSVGAIKQIDALAEASASAAAWTCGEHTAAEAEVHATAKAVAKATAKALSAAWAGCDVTSDGFACADASTWIEETAYSVAVAYAELWAISLNCEGTCYVSVDTAVASLSTILVKAATDAYAHVCSAGGYWTADALAVDIEAASLTAVAEASVAAISVPPHVCVAGGYVSAQSTPTPNHNPAS